MGGLLHLSYFNQSWMARKIHLQKNRVDGREAPQNSLELQVETSKSYRSVGEVPYSDPVEEDYPEKNTYPTEVSVKKLINEEISKESNTGLIAPGIVARLMGMDVLPLETKSAVHLIDKKNDHSGIKSSKKEKKGRSSVSHVSSYSDSSSQIQFGTVYPCRDDDFDRWSSGKDFEKPRPREHPQEEELQKFKKEFQAWQAARSRECSKVVELEGIPLQKLAVENLNKEKMTIYSSSRTTGKENPGEPISLASKSTAYEREGLQRHRQKMELFPFDEKESHAQRSRSKSIDFEPTSLMIHHEKWDHAPTRIVILKPGPDIIHDHEACWTSALETLDGRGSIGDFLEEVKERLKCELQGKTLKKGSVVRGSGIETPFSEKASDPKQIARHIAKHVRESVSRDLGVGLVRPESTRSYRREIDQVYGPGSPVFVNKDTKRFLSARLRNVLKKETHSESYAIVSGMPKTSMLGKERFRLKQWGDTSLTGNEWNHWEVEKDEHEIQSTSFRHGDANEVFNRELSPRNLIRSLSAPVSGTSFGKLLLEDRNVLTGAQIMRKHEDNFSVDVRRKKKDRFNFREKVSNFRYNFTLRRRLFGKKLHSMIESHGPQCDHGKHIMSKPTIIVNPGKRLENSTEVPPSPASMCSTPREDFQRTTDDLSQISTPDVIFEEGDAVPQVFRDISSNLNELRRQLKELDNRVEDMSAEEDLTPSESEVVEHLEDQAKAYVQNLLLASGLYDGSSDKALSRWDPLAKPICNTVFEKVEESYYKNLTEDDGCTWIKNQKNTKKKAEHRMLLDLLNEALALLLGPPVTMSSFMRKINNSSMLLRPLRGRKLLDSVWEMISVYLEAPASRCNNYGLDSMVVQDLGSAPWSPSLIDEEVNCLGREVECVIIGELVEEILKDMQFEIMMHVKVV